MPRDADATRARLLQAAIDEFSLYGLAGGRVDRIAATANANKRAIYDYFGSKERLFEEVTAIVAARLVEAVPLDGADLPGYAGALFDYVQAHPETGRLLRWRQLESPDAANPTSERFFTELEVLRRAAAESDCTIDAVDLVVLVIGMANAWDLVGHEIGMADGSDPNDPARIAVYRAAVVEATRRLSGPDR